MYGAESPTCVPNARCFRATLGRRAGRVRRFPDMDMGETGTPVPLAGRPGKVPCGRWRKHRFNRADQRRPKAPRQAGDECDDRTEPRSTRN